MKIVAAFQNRLENDSGPIKNVRWFDASMPCACLQGRCSTRRHSAAMMKYRARRTKSLTYRSRCLATGCKTSIRQTHTSTYAMRFQILSTTQHLTFASVLQSASIGNRQYRGVWAGDHRLVVRRGCRKAQAWNRLPQVAHIAQGVSGPRQPQPTSPRTKLVSIRPSMLIIAPLLRALFWHFVSCRLARFRRT